MTADNDYSEKTEQQLRDYITDWGSGKVLTDGQSKRRDALKPSRERAKP